MTDVFCYYGRHVGVPGKDTNIARFHIVRDWVRVCKLWD